MRETCVAQEIGRPGWGVIAAAALLLAGCGGGGGGSGATQPPGPTQPPVTTPPPPPPPVNRLPVADAGAPRAVHEGVVVQLDGRASIDEDGDALTYQWAQAAGPAVSLSDAAAADPTFVAPAGISIDEELVFELVVHDGTASSAPSTLAITVRPSPPSTADSAAPVLAAALAEGQFTLNNPWTQADLDNENITADIGYQVVAARYKETRSYTTLVAQYWARRRQCEKDSQTFYEVATWTSPVNPHTIYEFQDQRCYPTLFSRPPGLTPATAPVGAAASVLHRYGYYCGAGYTPYSAFTPGAPEPLDGVDYCCRLHDYQVWYDGDESFSNECGMAMCLSKATETSAGLLASLADIEEARAHWYAGATTVCGGNQSNTLPPPLLGP